MKRRERRIYLPFCRWKSENIKKRRIYISTNYRLAANQFTYKNGVFNCIDHFQADIITLRVRNTLDKIIRFINSDQCNSPRFEPKTYNALCARISGIATASRYASEELIFSNKQLPGHYKNWEEFRDFLLDNIPNEDHKEKFRLRFSKQQKNERIYQAQVGQLLINDYENSRPFDTKKDEKPK